MYVNRKTQYRSYCVDLHAHLCLCCPHEINGVTANSADPDQTAYIKDHSDPGLHCLLGPICSNLKGENLLLADSKTRQPYRTEVKLKLAKQLVEFINNALVILCYDFNPNLHLR